MKFSFFNFSFVQKIQLELFVNASFSKHQSKRTSRTPSNDRQNLEEDISTRNRSFRTTFSNLVKSIRLVQLFDVHLFRFV